MDESEKRRERLKAMRMECAQTELPTSPVPFATAGRLSNPLVQSSVTTPSTETSPGLPRFEYYTDPMSAYSSNKMRSKDYHQIPQESCPPHTSSSPVSRVPPFVSVGMRSPVPCQFQMNYSADQRSHGTPHSTATPPPWRSPIRMGSPFPGPGGILTPGAADQRPYGTPHTIGTLSSWRSPIHMGSPFPRPGGTPILGAAGCNQPLGWPADGVSSSSPSPNYGQGSSPSHNSVNHQFNYSPSPSTGHGGGRGRTPSSGHGRGRGRGLHNSPAAKERADLYYKTSMVQDPWSVLKPILRNLPTTLKYLKATASEKPWLPKSVSMKKAKVSEEAAGFQSKPSLAECLALSLEEAVNDTEESEVALI